MADQTQPQQESKWAKQFRLGPRENPRFRRRVTALHLRRSTRPKYKLDYFGGLFDGAILWILVGLMLFGGRSDPEAIEELLWLFPDSRWTFEYLFDSTMTHLGGIPFVALVINFMGVGFLLLHIIGAPMFTILFFLSVASGHVVNNLLGPLPVLGTGAGVMGLIAFACVHLRNEPLKIYVRIKSSGSKAMKKRRRVATPVRAWMLGCLLVCGLVLMIAYGWHFMSPWSKLGGFATGLLFAFGYSHWSQPKLRNPKLITQGQ